MQISCPSCGKQLPISNQLRGTSIRCSRCNTLVDDLSALPSSGPRLPSYATPNDDKWTNNNAILIVAVSCLSGLVLVLSLLGLLILVLRDRSDPDLESAPEAIQPSVQRTIFEEGYSIILPPGFQKESREESEQGDVIYRFVSNEGYGFTLAIVFDESFNGYDSPPYDLSEALIERIGEFSEGVGAPVHAERINIDGLPASVFQYHEMETYRGITFTRFMVAMDKKKRCFMKFAGKYGDYRKPEDITSFPDEWYDSLLTFRRIRKSQNTQKETRGKQDSDVGRHRSHAEMSNG